MKEGTLMKKVLFIVNPASAGGRTLKRWDEALKYLNDADFEYEVKFTESQGCAKEFAYSSCIENYSTVVSMGGDGTANEVINGLMTAKLDGFETPNFTIFPSGTGSDSVRTLGIPKDIEGFFRLVLANDSKKIDIGIADFKIANSDEIGLRYFLNACDVGIGATVANTVNSMNKDSEQQTGKAKYFRAILDQVFKFKPFSATVQTGAETYELDKTVIIAICNGMFFGGGVKISPISKMDDGTIELFATKKVSIPALLNLVSKVYTGSHVGHPKVKFHRNNEFLVKTEKPQLLETDGEICGLVTEVKFSIIPDTLDVLY